MLLMSFERAICQMPCKPQCKAVVWLQAPQNTTGMTGVHTGHGALHRSLPGLLAVQVRHCTTSPRQAATPFAARSLFRGRKVENVWIRDRVARVSAEPKQLRSLAV